MENLRFTALVHPPLEQRNSIWRPRTIFRHGLVIESSVDEGGVGRNTHPTRIPQRDMPRIHAGDVSVSEQRLDVVIVTQLLFPPGVLYNLGKSAAVLFKG